MELLLEDYALGRLIEENDSGENLSIEEARALYKKLKD
jgi:mRNA interferase RelE/StbE